MRGSCVIHDLRVYTNTACLRCRVQPGLGGYPKVTYSNGRMVYLRNVTASMNTRGHPGYWRSYDGTKAPDTRITDYHRLVLFHYVTRSLQDYTEKKLKAVTGSQSTAYLIFCEKHMRSPEDPEMLRMYENLAGFDGKAPVCASAIGYHSNCCGDR
jgi:hypothetical protein